MTVPRVNPSIGHKLRELRLERGQPQADVARSLGVSAAYLNLIEKGKRAVQLPLLWKALELYGVELEPFMASLGEKRLEDGLAKLLDEPLLKSLQISEEDLRALSAEPKAATTITALFNLYKNARGQLDQILAALHRADRDAHEDRVLRQIVESSPALPRATSDDEARPSQRGAEPARFDYSPFDEVIDFLQANDNHFAPLEAAAEKVRADSGWGRRFVSDQITAALEQQFGVRVVMHPPGRTSRGETSVIRHYDAERGVLTLTTNLLEQRLKFQLAHTMGLRLLDERPELIDGPAARFASRHAETKKLMKVHLANYFAGAVLMPYGDFFREVQRTRYDVEVLSDLFETSYEAAAHRICNLADPKRRAIPMHFLRSDIGGNISKRYAGTGIRFPAGTGSCPKWAVHMAFLTPSVITKQYSVFPDGGKFFCFARVVTHPHEGNVMRGTVYSIGMGTSADAAKHLAYAADMPVSDARDFERVAIPVGVACRFCERTDCSQRAAPSYKFAFSVDEYTKKDNVFSPLLGGEQQLVQLGKRG
jgi:hypothetical protein